MSSSDDNGTSTARRYDAEASKAALLKAASELFDEVGYERATTREIGERAGVDAAMIARYFECKEGLFLAALAEPRDEHEIDFEPVRLLGLLIERWDERGHSPISRALASPSLSEGVRQQVRDIVRNRIVEQLGGLLEERGLDQPQLRAELLVALAVGVAMTRANGTLDALAAAAREDVLEVLGPVVEALTAH